MSLKYFVYVSSVSNLSDARYCSAMMVDCLGFNLDQNSKNKISIDNISQISSWINGVKLVGEFNKSSCSYINKTLQKTDFSLIQMDISNICVKLNFDYKNIIVKIKDLSEHNNSILPVLKYNFCETEIIIIEKFNESNSMILEYLAKKYKVLINPLKSINETKEILEKYNLGLHLYGSDEIRPGFKDYDSLSSVLDEI
tara:strand:- start:297 stop:890 length:594 start_codon:yes stop_codon:yes gene_type:complete